MTTPQNANLERWSVQYLRFLSFPANPSLNSGQTWWKDLTGMDRETKTEKKTEIKEEGVFRGSTLSLLVDLFRIQWTTSPRITPDLLFDGLPTLGPLTERAAEFSELMHLWIELSPPVKRFGFAGVLLQEVPDRASGYHRLSEYLKTVQVDPDARDFLYRINRPVQSQSVQGVTINRLNTWSVSKFDVVIRAVSSDTGEKKLNDEFSRQAKLACLLDFDINNVPKSDGSFTKEEMHVLLNEMIDLATNLAAKGDVRT